MAWYSKIKNNIVEDVIYLIDNKDSDWLHREYGGVWLRCNEDKSIRNGLPCVGYVYDKENDVFYAQQPFESWVLNTETWLWEPPIKCPNDGKKYIWDEETQTWKEVN